MFPCAPKLSSLQHCSCTAKLTARANAVGFGIARAGQNKDTLPLSTAGLLCSWHCGDTCHGHFAVGHCRGTPRLGTAGKLGVWALQGYLVVFALQG